jgi:hypothetical protein
VAQAERCATISSKNAPVAHDPDPEVSALARSAERFDELADTAELMGDAETAATCREHATDCRMRAMTLLDD